MQKNLSSFRDTSGYVFEDKSHVYRAINKSYEREFEFLMASGLAQLLFQRELLIKHVAVNLPNFDHADLFAVIEPEKLPIISYPYEWSFSQLKDAALLTLEMLTVSLEYGMILKDASAFNIQFKGYKPVFIDTLSFSIYEEGQVWYGYRQFCEHFLSPLCLSSYLGVTHQSLLRLGVDGVPVKMASELLPWYTWLKSVPLLHIHLHAKTVDLYSNKIKSNSPKARKISKGNLLAMITHLQDFIVSLRLKKSDKTQWRDYDKEIHYSEAGKNDKALIIREFVDQVKPFVVWDIGANDGFFSRSIADSGIQVLSLDADPLAVEKNFKCAKKEKIRNIYPLLFDLTNPTPNLGWANEERTNLSLRSKPDLILSLALIHHIVITHNIPFYKVAKYFAGICEWLIIEFVPKEDNKIKILPETAGKKMYSRESFEAAFFDEFNCVLEKRIADSERTLLLLRKIR